MITRTALGLLLLVTVILAHPADAADKLSMQTLGARLAAKPTGADAEALAEDSPRLVRQGPGRQEQRAERREPEGRRAG